MTDTLDSTSLAARFAAPLTADSTSTVLCWLEHEGVIAVEGPDSARFLHGQLTCDVNALQVGQSTLGARCNPKGRMQSSFRLLRAGAELYYLVMHRELVERQLGELKKYAVFFKAQLSDVSQDWLRLGLLGPDFGAALTHAELPCPEEARTAVFAGGTLVLKTGAETAEAWLVPDAARSALERLCSVATPANLQAWLLGQVRSGVGMVFPETYEAFIPQMLNLQQLDGVSFRKGCYTGQEIVARMQYLGKLKRRMYRLLLSGETLPPPATGILDRDSGQTVGEVVMAARSESGVEVLAVLQKDAAQLATLVVGDIDGPLLSPSGLPYDSELEAREADKEI